ncbi:MAG: hypothetical protein V3S19_03565 [Gemmatimonadales bacterium]
MPDGSLFLEFANATAVAWGRLWPSWARLYPALRRDRWYRVWYVGQDAYGVFLDIGRPRYVSRDHVQIERMPDQPASRSSVCIRGSMFPLAGQTATSPPQTRGTPFGC